MRAVRVAARWRCPSIRGTVRPTRCGSTARPARATCPSHRQPVKHSPGTCGCARRTRRLRCPRCGWAPKGALGDTGIPQVLRRRCKLAGIPNINPHRFRHTFAHRWKAKGGSTEELMYLGGWKSMEMVRRYGRSAEAARAQDRARALALGDDL